MKKTHIVYIVIVSIVLVFGISVTILLNSNYYYSKKLVSAIREENIISVKEIIEKKPTCINKYPSITSKWWHSAMNWRVCYPINEACYTDNIELVKLLIENGANVNCNDGLTPLSITYGGKRDNWYEISQLLIQSGALLEYDTEYSGGKACILQDIVKKKSGSLLEGYVPDNSEEVMLAFDYAIKNSDHSKIDWSGTLQHSVSNDRVEIVKFLLDKGYCNVDDVSNGMTALMYAARDSTPEMMQLLLDYGADKSVKTSDGKTAYEYAVQSNNTDIIALLES